MAIKTRDVKVIEESDWNQLVEETYGRPYHFQQQYDCQDRGYFELSIPTTVWDDENVMYSEIPEEVNGEKMGVKFEKWLERDPKQPLAKQEFDWQLKLFWERNFYPSVYTVAKDLYKRGLIPEGEYLIHIDW
jgi:hypothetical protein